MTATQTKLNELFEEMVPQSGAAPTLAGEIVRAICRVSYRNWNDGDHLGVGYGRETCNPAGRYLDQKCGPEVGRAIWAIWGVESDDEYDKGLGELEAAVLAFLEAHPEAKTTPNTEDMWDYQDPDEDVDTYDEDEDDADCDGYDEEGDEEW